MSDRSKSFDAMRKKSIASTIVAGGPNDTFGNTMPFMRCTSDCSTVRAPYRPVAPHAEEPPIKPNATKVKPTTTHLLNAAIIALHG